MLNNIIKRQILAKEQRMTQNKRELRQIYKELSLMTVALLFLLTMFVIYLTNL